MKTMRKFKHTKTGDEVKTSEVEGYYFNEDNMIHAKYIENSADWEELKPEYPKVISFIRNKNIGIMVDGVFNKGTIWRLKESELFVPDGAIRNQLPLSALINDKDHDIFEVAKSETETFTVGDKMTFNGLGGSDWQNKSTEILGFEYRQNGELAAKYANGIVSVDKIQKAKEPLFVTEDGVGIFEGMSYYTVFEKNVGEATAFEVNGIFTAKHEYRKIKYIKYFTTIAAAEEYIRLNKPTFSIKQIITDIVNSDIPYDDQMRVFKALRIITTD